MADSAVGAAPRRNGWVYYQVVVAGRNRSGTPLLQVALPASGLCNPADRVCTQAPRLPDVWLKVCRLGTGCARWPTPQGSTRFGKDRVLCLSKLNDTPVQTVPVGHVLCPTCKVLQSLPCNCIRIGIGPFVAVNKGSWSIQPLWQEDGFFF